MAAECKKELMCISDDISKWFDTEAGKYISFYSEEELLINIIKVSNDYPNLYNTYVSATKNKADPHVIALSLYQTSIIVTDEKGGSATKLKIPYIAQQYNIPVMNIVELIQNEDWIL